MLNWLVVLWRRIGRWVHGEKLPQTYYRSNLARPPPLMLSRSFPDSNVGQAGSLRPVGNQHLPFAFSRCSREGDG